MLKKIKQGSVFALTFTAKEFKSPLDLTDYAIECHFQNSDGELTEVAAIERTIEPHKFIITNATGIMNWPIGSYIADIKITKDGKPLKSDCFSFTVIESITP